MGGWFHPDLTAAQLMALAGDAVRTARPHAAPVAAVSHVGFRCQEQAVWERALEMAATLGQVHMTFKPDGRKIPFVELAAPVEVDGLTLAYLELPAPKPGRGKDEPELVVVFLGEDMAPVIADGLDIRRQPAGAMEFIRRDKERAA